MPRLLEREDVLTPESLRILEDIEKLLIDTILLFENALYEHHLHREELYVQSQIKKNSKYHSWWQWLF